MKTLILYAFLMGISLTVAKGQMVELLPEEVDAGQIARELGWTARKYKVQPVHGKKVRIVAKVKRGDRPEETYEHEKLVGLPETEVSFVLRNSPIKAGDKYFLPMPDADTHLTLSVEIEDTLMRFAFENPLNQKRGKFFLWCLDGKAKVSFAEGRRIILLVHCELDNKPAPNPEETFARSSKGMLIYLEVPK